MIRIFWCLAVLLTLNGCGESSSEDRSELITESIVGSWGFTYEGNNCREAYHFRENGSIEINSGDEIIIGTYVFDETVASDERHELTISLLSDNGEPDCLGNREDDSGARGVMYIKFDGSSQILWYSQQRGGTAINTMVAVNDIPISEAPFLNIGPNLYAYEREEIQLVANTDALENATYLWTQLSGPVVSLNNADTLTATFTLPNITADTSLLFNFEITLANGSKISDQMKVYATAYVNIRDITFADMNLSNCISDSVSNVATSDITELTSLSCENITNLAGIASLSYLTNLNLKANTLDSLTPILALEKLEHLDISGNDSLDCEQIEELQSSLDKLSSLTKDDLCITNRGVELGAIGFDLAVDEIRKQIYVSLPSKNEIAVISYERMRVVDRIRLGGAPYGVDLSIDGDSLYVAVRGTDSVAVIDLESRHVTTIPLANKTGNASLYDVIEAAPNRVFVSAAPGSSGFAYIAQINLDESNLVTRAASNRIIRSRPTFARSPDYRALYLSEGFSPNSLYKLSLMNSVADIILEDDHGSVSGSYNMSVNLTGTRVALASGQVLRTGSFVQSGRVINGLSVASQLNNHLFVLSNNSDMSVFDFDTLEEIASITTNCEFGTTSKFGTFNQDNSFMFLQQDVLCINTQISQSNDVEPYPSLVFDDLGFEECVIASAQANGYEQAAEIEMLDCSSAQKNIISLGSIEKLENLRHLDISGHSVFSLEPLAKLNKLETLTIKDSNISDLEPLSGIGVLSELNVTGSERIPCNELYNFQQLGVTVTADTCTQNTRIELGGIGTDMAYNDTTNKLYISVPSMLQVIEIDIASEQITHNYPVGGKAQRIDLSSDGKTIYTTLYGDGDIAYLTLADSSVEKVDISTELDDDRVWDIAEVSPNRIVVSSNPGSNGFAYIVEVRRDLNNTAKRVANKNIIRAHPEFAVAENGSSVYVGSGFSPNSLYKLDASLADMPIALEDNHGDVSGTSHLSLNKDNSLIYLASGQVLSTTTFTQVATFNSGRSWLSLNGQSLYIADGESNAIGIYDINTTAKIGKQGFGCEVTSIQELQEIENLGVSVLGDDLVCFTRVIPFN